jgi:hypothetical protein
MSAVGDLVWRLRNTAEHWQRAAKTKEQKKYAAELADELREAADEIERLSKAEVHKRDNVTILSGG